MVRQLSKHPYHNWLRKMHMRPLPQDPAALIGKMATIIVDLHRDGVTTIEYRDLIERGIHPDQLRTHQAKSHFDQAKALAARRIEALGARS